MLAKKLKALVQALPLESIHEIHAFNFVLSDLLETACSPFEPEEGPPFT